MSQTRCHRPWQFKKHSSSVGTLSVYPSGRSGKSIFRPFSGHSARKFLKLNLFRTRLREITLKSRLPRPSIRKFPRNRTTRKWERERRREWSHLILELNRGDRERRKGVWRGGPDRSRREISFSQGTRWKLNVTSRCGKAPRDGRRNERYRGCINNKRKQKAASDVFFGHVTSRDNWYLESPVSGFSRHEISKIPSRVMPRNVD